LKTSDLVSTKTEALFEVFDHLLDLPSLGVELDDIDCGKTNIGTDQVADLFSLLFDDYHGHLAQVFDGSNKPGNLQGLVPAI